MHDLDELRRAATAALEALRRGIETEIQRYPAPISGCDAQFNHLLAERRRVSDALSDLDAAVFVPTPRAPVPGRGIESR